MQAKRDAIKAKASAKMRKMGLLARVLDAIIPWSGKILSVRGVMKTKFSTAVLTFFVLCSPLMDVVRAEDSPGFLFVNATVTDTQKLGAYGAALPPVYAKYGGRYLIFGGVGRGITPLAGSLQHESVIFAEFDSLADVEKFWWSDEYRAVVPLRDGAGQFDVLGLSGTGIEPYSAQNDVQPAYMFTYIKMINRDKAMEYMAAAQDTISSSPGRIIAMVRPEDMSVLEGSTPEFTIEISSWPSLAAIDAFMSDPMYQAAIPLRDAGMEVIVLTAELPKPR